MQNTNMNTNDWQEQFNQKISRHYSRVYCSEENPMSPTKDVKNFIQELLDKQREALIKLIEATLIKIDSTEDVEDKCNKLHDLLTELNKN